MLKIQSKVSFGSENLECLINEIIQGKIKEVVQKLKNRDIALYNKNKDYSSTNISGEKADEIE